VNVYYNCIMVRIFLFVLALCFLIPAVAVFAQEDEPEKTPIKRGDFWISLGGDTALYSVSGAAFGGSFALGYGSGSSVGLKAVYFFWEEGIDTLEINVILRFYLLGANAYSGPYLQLMGGPALFSYTDEFTIPSEWGTISAGLCFGWRFLFLDRWFVEPAVRGGYPYIFGAGISAGVRF